MCLDLKQLIKERNILDLEKLSHTITFSCLVLKIGKLGCVKCPDFLGEETIFWK